MLKIMFACSMLALATPLAAAPSLSAADRAALEQLKTANDTAWDRKDLATISSQYVADATVRVAPDAALVEGRRAIEGFFRASFDRRQGEFRHLTTLAHLDALDADTVFSEGDVRVEKREPDGSWALARRFRTVSVVVRDGAGWKLRSVRAIPLN